jgi:branched-chain amino acid aminotransferase
MIPFDDRDGSIWIDGKLVSWRSAKIHVLTHGLHYASCVFEGERIYSGRVFKLHEHSQRLIDSARIIGFEIPYSADELNAATNEVIRVNDLADGYVRPIAWRGSEQISIGAPSSRVHVAIAAWAWPSYFKDGAAEKGIRLQVSNWARPAPNSAPTTSKASGLYVICSIAKHDALAAGYDDALMYDWRGFIAEATGANIFFVADGLIYTPEPDCFLDGITRRTVIGIAAAKGMKVVSGHFGPELLQKATEAFLTGTAAEITPVREIGGNQYAPGQITQVLRDEYRKLTRAAA